MIVSLCSFLLPWLRKIADALHIADYTRKVIQTVALTRRTFFEITLVDVSATVANGIGDIKGEIVTAFLRSDAQKLAVLFLA